MSTFSGDTGREEEDGGGWSRLAPSKEERKAEAIAKVNQGMLEALNASLPWLKAQQAAHSHTKDCPYCFVVDICEAAISNAQAQLEKK